MPNRPENPLRKGVTSGVFPGKTGEGVKVWQVMEVILFELVESPGKRFLDPDLRFNLLRP